MTRVSETESWLLAQLRDGDRDRYLATLLSPLEHRKSLSALYVFSVELARVRERVSEPLPGEVRLQYWRDLLTANEGTNDPNPLAAVLLETIASNNLPRQAFINMIDARVFDLYDDPMASIADFEGYAGETASALMQLANLILCGGKAKQFATSAGHAGVAHGVAGALLLLPRHRALGQVFIPTEILSATGLDRETFLIGTDSVRVGNAIRAFSAFGLEHLKMFRIEGRLPKAVVPAYLPMVACEKILENAEKLGENVFSGALQPSQWKRQLLMMRSLLVRKI